MSRNWRFFIDAALDRVEWVEEEGKLIFGGWVRAAKEYAEGKEYGEVVKYLQSWRRPPGAWVKHLAGVIWADRIIWPRASSEFQLLWKGKALIGSCYRESDTRVFFQKKPTCFNKLPLQPSFTSSVIRYRALFPEGTCIHVSRLLAGRANKDLYFPPEFLPACQHWSPLTGWPKRTGYGGFLEKRVRGPVRPSCWPKGLHRRKRLLIPLEKNIPQ
jgi:hypothetical protein